MPADARPAGEAETLIERAFNAGFNAHPAYRKEEAWRWSFGREREYVSDYWVMLQLAIAVAGMAVLIRAFLT